VDIIEHWEDVYKTKCFADVGWYESDPQKSLDLIVGAASNSLGRVIDIGGGQRSQGCSFSAMGKLLSVLWAFAGRSTCTVLIRLSCNFPRLQ
jgi:hypothetical protein